MVIPRLQVIRPQPVVGLQVGYEVFYILVPEVLVLGEKVYVRGGVSTIG